MASNNFQQRSDPALLQVANQAHTTITGDPIGYGIQASQLTALNTAKTTLDTTIDGYTAARAALAAAAEARDAARADTITALSNIGATIYNYSPVTNEMIAAAGYAVRDSSPSIVIPTEIANLVAVPNANGSALIKWSRNGNPYSVQFSVEWRTEEGEWQWLASPTRTRVTVAGVTPGVTRYFRVTAIRGDLSSFPSEQVVVYASEPPSVLALAA